MTPLDTGPPEKRISPWRGADSETHWKDWNEGQNSRPHRRLQSPYRQHPVMAALVLDALIRCGGAVRP